MGKNWERLMSNGRYIIVLSLLVLAGVASYLIKSRTVDSGPLLPHHLPEQIKEWVGTPFSTLMPSDLRPGDYMLREYRKEGGVAIKMMVVFSPTENYHPPALCYRGIGLKTFYLPPLVSSSGRIVLAGLGAHVVNESISVYHGFYISGRIMPDGIGKKMYEVRERIKKGRVEQYFLEVMLSVEKGKESMARETVKSFVDLMEPYLLDVR
ncbi:MAG: EpsI family protein [Syntrophales bacterium]|nr:EpsI family protein [Syntrophales bacterium]